MTAGSTERLEASLERQLNWIAATESRIALIVPLATALFGSVAIKYTCIQTSDFWIQFASWSTLALLATVMVTAAVAIFPRTKGPAHSLIFFGGISQQSAQEFHDAVTESTEDQYRNDLIEQVHINANIASIKFRWIRRSMALLLASFVPWALSVASLY